MIYPMQMNRSARFDRKRNSAFLLGALAVLLAAYAFSSDFRIIGLDRAGNVSLSNAFPSGVCTVEAATVLTGSVSANWRVHRNYFTTNSTGQGVVTIGSSNHFFRLLAADVSTNTPAGYTNLLLSYGLLHTIAGNGYGGVDRVNYWQPAFEGGYATSAGLSRPHFAIADERGNVFIVDKDSQNRTRFNAPSKWRGTHS